MSTTYHIQRRLPRKGGNSWYKAKGVRVAKTYCGEPITEYDVPWRYRNGSGQWTHPIHGEMVPCQACKAAL